MHSGGCNGRRRHVGIKNCCIEETPNRSIDPERGSFIFTHAHDPDRERACVDLFAMGKRTEEVVAETNGEGDG